MFKELKAYYTKDNFKGSSVRSSYAKKANPRLLLWHSTWDGRETFAFYDLCRHISETSSYQKKWN